LIGPRWLLTATKSKLSPIESPLVCLTPFSHHLHPHKRSSIPFPLIIPSTLEWYVDTIDDAILHIAALIYSDVVNERIFAFAERFNWSQIVSIYKKLFPDRTFVDDLPDYGRDLCTVPNERALELLKRCGREGWTGLEESLRVMTKQFVEQ
jgi:hypothetical protein